MAIDEKYGGLEHLVQLGKEKGYVLYDEVSEILPAVEIPGGAELEDVLAGLDGAGIEILEEPKDFEKKVDEAEDLLDLELPTGAGADKLSDPGADVPAGNGHGPAAHARWRSGDRAAHRARPEDCAEVALARLL